MFNVTFQKVLNSVDLRLLECLAASQVAILVCETEDVQDMIRIFRKGCAVAFSDSEWKQLCNEGRKKLDQIEMPDLITDIVSKHLWTISFEISKWIAYHIEDIDFDCSLTFCWTPHPNIDYVKTAEMLAKAEVLDAKKRFKLACLYCLESEVRHLWEIMSLAERRSFFVRRNSKKSNQNPIILYWTYHIQEVPMDSWSFKMLNFPQLFKFAVKNGYLRATKFFFDNLKSQIRNKMILNCFYAISRGLYLTQGIKKDHLAIVYFLACQLSSISRILLYSDMFDYIFRYFLDWPWQKHFITVVNQMKIYMRVKNFGRLLQVIFDKDMEGYQDHAYKKLFIDFWHWGRDSFRTYVNRDSRIGYSIFLKFVKMHFGFVFEEQSFALKQKLRSILFQPYLSDHKTYFKKENVEFLKFLVRAQVTNKAAIERFSDRNLGTSNYLPLGELVYLVDALLNTT